MAANKPLSPSAKAHKTAVWATTMAKWRIGFETGGTLLGSGTRASGRPVRHARRWQLVAFNGPNGGESRGVGDFLAIRKDHRDHGTRSPFNRGDLFEIVLVQVKGGTAPWPRDADLQRLRAVRRRYRARSVVLAKWEKGTQPTFYNIASRRVGSTGGMLGRRRARPRSSSKRIDGSLRRERGRGTA